MKAITALALYAMNVAVNAGTCEKILLDKRGESITASRDNLIGTIDIYDTMIIEMDVAIGVVDSSSELWESVLHVGNTNDDRWPGIWLHNTAGSEGTLDGFTLSYGDVSNPNNYQDKTAAGGAFSDNSIVSYKSTQTQSHLTIMENGAIIYDQAYLAHPTPTGVNVYVGDPWYGAADATITNLLITTEVECDCSAVDIDGYLTYCSDVFGETEDSVSALRSDVDTNTAAVGTNTANIADNSANIGNLQSSVGSLQTESGTLRTEVDDIKATIAKIADVDGQTIVPTLFNLDINRQNY